MVVGKLNFVSMGDDALVVCGGWWDGIGRNEDVSIFGWLGGHSGVFGFRLGDMMDVRIVRYCT